MISITLPSPAKINLFLKIRNKRPDGYHNLETLFQRISLADAITFRATQDTQIKIHCDHPHVPTGPKNLVHKIARLFQEEYGVSQGAKIEIRKRIPVAAGLAGGSSNAATAIEGLSRVWGLNLSHDEMVAMAKRVGSDVAFFLYDASWALGTERGDKIKILNILKKYWHILVVPRIKMYSWKVYGEFQPSDTNVLTNKNDDVNILTHNLKKGNILEAGRYLANDLEPAMFRLCPRLQALKERLKSLNAKGVMVSGSGPAVFGLMETEGDARAAQAVLSKRYAQVFVVKTL